MLASLELYNVVCVIVCRSLSCSLALSRCESWAFLGVHHEELLPLVGPMMCFVVCCSVLQISARTRMGWLWLVGSIKL